MILEIEYIQTWLITAQVQLIQHQALTFINFHYTPN